MTYKVQYKLWIDIGNFGPPSPGLNYVRVLDNVGENRQDCKLFVESTGKQLPPPMPFPNNKILISLFTQYDRLILKDQEENYLATISSCNMIETTPINPPSRLEATNVGVLELF